MKKLFENYEDYEEFYELVNQIQKYNPYLAKSEIIDVLGSLEFTGVYLYKETISNNPSKLWRITGPLYWIFVIICVILAPLKAIFTGKVKYRESSWVYKLDIYWLHLLNFEL